MTFLSPLLAVGIGFVVFFLSKKNSDNLKQIVYVDESKLFSKDDFRATPSYQFLDYTMLGLDESKKKVAQGAYDGVLYIPQIDSLEVLAKSIAFYSKESPSISMIERIENRVATKLRNLKLTGFGIDLSKIKASRIKAEVKMYNFSGEKSSKLISWLKIGVGAVAGYLLMMFVIIYGTSVMRSVIEEKTTRIVEVIVSSVKPFQLMLGKIIGNASAGLLQFFIWGILMLVISLVVSSVFGVSMSEVSTSKMTPAQLNAMQAATEGDTIQLLVQEIFRLPLLTLFVLFIFYFLGGYFLYSALFAAVGAAVDNETDTQQFMFPIMLPLILGVYIGFATVMNDPHGPIATIFSIIPFTSPIVMLMRVPFGVVWYEIAISMALLLFTFVGMVWMASKIYRVGILMYGKKPTYKDLWKWLKYKG